MEDRILALAILEPLPGKEEELIAMLHDLYALLFRKGYSRDTLYRDPKRPGTLVRPAATGPHENRAKRPSKTPRFTNIGCVSPNSANSRRCTKSWRWWCSSSNPYPRSASLL